MIELKRCNYITGESNAMSYGLFTIIEFLELDGRNILLFSIPNPSLLIARLFRNKIEYSDLSDFKSKIEDKSNLFRADLIIFDFWHLGLTDIIEYKIILDSIDIDYIILAKLYHYKSSEDVTDYHIKKRSSTLSIESSYTITNNINGWSSDISLLLKSHIRDRKIDGIIGDLDL